MDAYYKVKMKGLDSFKEKIKEGTRRVMNLKAGRKKSLENNPASSSDDNPVVFNTSTVPWQARTKEFISVRLNYLMVSSAL
ncbi:unnamed protein product [Lupinus luteus]|uniref:Uncharacterized protein n=1 Tax=Lupinus luteus TaxID=3873 RepID=A0AAV1YB06_LUPLU